MTIFLLVPLELFKWFLMLFFIYLFFVVLYLMMFNLVFVAIAVWSIKKLWLVLDAWTDRVKFKWVTKDLVKYVKE